MVELKYFLKTKQKLHKENTWSFPLEDLQGGGGLRTQAGGTRHSKQCISKPSMPP